jgi:hypothetical protein
MIGGIKQASPTSQRSYTEELDMRARTDGTVEQIHLVGRDISDVLRTSRNHST